MYYKLPAFIRRWLHIAYEWLRHEPFVLWFARFVYAQHNARVLVDMEHRLGCVLDAATNGMLSKAYYDVPTMTAAISDAFAAHGELYYAEGRADALEEHGITEEGPTDAEPSRSLLDTATDAGMPMRHGPY